MTPGELEPDELWVLERFAEGWTSTEIAQHLRIGPRAARAMLAAASRRLQARSRPHTATMLVLLNRGVLTEGETEAV